MAFRSLSRPSSAISALASTLRSFSLDLASFRSRPLLRLFRDRAARASFIASPVQFSRCAPRSLFAHIELVFQKPFAVKLMAPGLSPRFRDSSKRYRNLPKRSGRSLLWLSPPSVFVLPSVLRGFSPLLAVPSLALPHSLLRLPVYSGFSFRVSASPSGSASPRSTWDSLGFRLHSPALAFLLLLNPRLSP